MTRTIITLACIALFFMCAVAPAQKPPPAEVANTVSNLWISQDFTGLTAYVTNLYATSSNYVPAFH